MGVPDWDSYRRMDLHSRTTCQEGTTVLFLRSPVGGDESPAFNQILIFCMGHGGDGLGSIRFEAKIRPVKLVNRPSYRAVLYHSIQYAACLGASAMANCVKLSYSIYSVQLAWGFSALYPDPGRPEIRFLHD